MGMCVNGVLTQPPLCVNYSQADFPLVNRANSMSCRRYKILFDYKRMEVFKCVQVVLGMKVIVLYFLLNNVSVLNGIFINFTCTLESITWLSALRIPPSVLNSIHLKETQFLVIGGVV